MRNLAIITGLILVAVLAAGSAPADPVTTRSLLAQMADLGALAEFPEPPYTCRQFSSYDRASTSPADQEKWFANADANQYLRIEEHDGQKEYVMMDADGPGAIVRIWSANPKGTLRIYLDKSAQPTLEVPMADLLGGKFAGIPTPIAHEASRGWNSYFPIPYATHCRITNTEGGFYYHVNYRTYPAGTAVTTFTPDDLKALAADVTAVAKALAAPSAASGERAVPRDEKAAIVQPGKELEVWKSASAPAAIRGLAFEVQAAERERALRELLLVLEFDDQSPVVCPLGDFFGAGPGARPYESLPLGVTAEGVLWSHWVMPFRSTARVVVRNAGAQAITLNQRHVEAAPYTWTDRTMYFRAGWRVSRDVPTRPFQDWNYVSVKGQGIFVGAAFTLANPSKAWWGEGDEKIYVDGEEFPSHFGTGTEDYYGYAWGSPALYANAYHAQPRCDGPGNYGITAVNRWHILDRIPFQRDFRFDMELWHWWEGIVPEMSVMTYWYARPGATSNRTAPQPADLQLVTLPPYVPPKVAGALEGEELRILAQTGQVGPQDIDKCSGERHLWWREGKPADKLVLAFPAPAAGQYRVFGRFVKAGDYGIVKLSVNDQAAAEPFDFYNDGVTVSDEMLIGVFNLLPEDNKLAVEIIGRNEKAIPGHMFGLDYLQLEPVK
ncbi:MAG TPA: DUF2961 domain-containing protein [Phycisphaerae bacterium]|nr:DUF2961 domain-containing protein [Phycisphaerae bacterium]